MSPSGKRLPKMLKAILAVLFIGAVFAGVYYFYVENSQAAWYNTSFQYRQKITIQASKVDADLTDFPVYVNFADVGSSTSFFTNVQSDGGDIRITTSDGLTEVPREVVSLSTASSTGELHFKAPTLASTTDSVFYIYYGSSTATNYATTSTYGAQNVWTNDYAAVYHMNVGNAVDSTGNGNGGTAFNDPATTAGKVGGAIDFDGGNDGINIGKPAEFLFDETTPFTLSVWANARDNVGFERVVSGDAGGGNHGYYLLHDHTGGDWVFRLDDASEGEHSGTAIETDTWVYFAGVYENPGVRFYEDNSLVNNTSEASWNPDWNQVTAFGIGYRATGNANFFNGLIDEVRIASTSRSDGWIGAEYVNQNSPDTFYIIGNKQAVLFPDTETQTASNVTASAATANGQIIHTGTSTVTERGFVYSTSTRADPGNIAPASSGYESVENETGSFETGAYSLSLTGLSPGTTYYVRAYAKNSAGYDYGSEANFTTEGSGSIDTTGVMSSTNYMIVKSSINIGGTENSTSANFILSDTIGQFAPGYATSTNYDITAGYRHMATGTSISISLSTSSDVTLTPSKISGISGGTGNGEATWTVTTDNTAGYKLTAEASTTPALKSGTDSFADYVPSGANPDYAFSVASTDSEFGFSPEGVDVISTFLDNGSACNTGSLNTADRCWKSFSTTPMIVAQSVSANDATGGATTTLKLRAEVGSQKIQPPGTYQAAITVTALPL